MAKNVKVQVKPGIGTFLYSGKVYSADDIFEVPDHVFKRCDHVLQKYTPPPPPPEPEPEPEEEPSLPEEEPASEVKVEMETDKSAEKKRSR